MKLTPLKWIGIGAAVLALDVAAILGFAGHKCHRETANLFPIIQMTATNAVAASPSLASSSLPNGAELVLLKFYSDRVHDFCFWAELHKLSYWHFVFLCGA